MPDPRHEKLTSHQNAASRSGASANVSQHSYTVPDPLSANVEDEDGSGARNSDATPTHMAGWPPDGTAAARVSRAADTRSAAAYNSQGGRLENLKKAVSLRESDLAEAQRAPGNAESKARLIQMAGRLHRARMELAELHASH